MTTLIKNGTIVTGSGSFPADILVEGEKIDALYTPGSDTPRADKTVDAAGSLIFPGFIDAHTHFDLHVAGTVTADDFETGTRAALKGGTTTIIDFGTQYAGETLAQGLKNWHEKADGKCSCDYSFHMSVSEWNADVEKEMQDMMDAGITSFKLYMTYDIQVDDKTLFEILQCLKKIHGIVGVHCENSGLIAALQEEATAAGKTGVMSHPETRPADAEAEAISRLLHLARVADVPVMVVHLTCEEGLHVIQDAGKSGQTVFAETCPQYLLLDDSKYALPGFEGAKYVCAPPLRKPKDNEALWNALNNGDIQTVSTDHCSFTTKQKELGKDDFRKIPGGLPGVETRGILIYSEGVAKGRITAEKMCELLSENPAKLYGLYPRKGVIAPGSDADLVIIDPNQTDTITAATQLQNLDYAPFEGLQTKGRITHVFLRGMQAVADGKVLCEKQGTFLKRSSFQNP